MFPFRLRVVPIGMDEDGDAIESCVVEHLDKAPAKQREPKGKWRELLWKVLNDMVGLGGEGVLANALLAAAAERVPAAIRPERFEWSLKQALGGLSEAGFVTVTGDEVRPAFVHSGA